MVWAKSLPTSVCTAPIVISSSNIASKCCWVTAAWINVRSTLNCKRISPRLLRPQRILYKRCTLEMSRHTSLQRKVLALYEQLIRTQLRPPTAQRTVIDKWVFLFHHISLAKIILNLEEVISQVTLLATCRRLCSFAYVSFALVVALKDQRRHPDQPSVYRQRPIAYV